jgi:hypothetical protein
MGPLRIAYEETTLLLNSLYLTFKAGLVVAITAGQVTSC